ncbi:hypothetical protein HDV05_000753, partial [Chytridiales sp. JEL 0842]
MAKLKKSTKRYLKNNLKDDLARRRKFKKDHKNWKPKKDPNAVASKRSAEDEAGSEDERLQNGVASDSEVDAGFELEAGLKGGIVDSDDSDDDENDEENSEEGSEVGALEEFDEFDDEEEEADEEEDPDDNESASNSDEEMDDAVSEDDENQDPDSLPAKKRHLRSEIAIHKKQLEEAMKKDPVFYKFLQENDKDLLNFGEDDDDEEGGEGEEGEEDDLEGIMKGQPDSDDDDDEEPMLDGEDNEDDEMEAEADIPVVTKAMIKSWRQSLIDTKSLRSAKKVLLAFKA